MPVVAYDIAWTTPFIVGGYYATGSISGTILQVINIGIGILIYMPFVKKLEKKKEAEASIYMKELRDVLIESERNITPLMLTELEGELGSVAKSLVCLLKIFLVGEFCLFSFTLAM